MHIFQILYLFTWGKSFRSDFVDFVALICPFVWRFYCWACVVFNTLVVVGSITHFATCFPTRYAFRCFSTEKTHSSNQYFILCYVANTGASWRANPIATSTLVVRKPDYLIQDGWCTCRLETRGKEKRKLFAAYKSP